MRKTNQGTKIGKVAKSSKSAKTAKTLSKDKTETDMTNKVEDKTAVESMEIDEPEITKVECVKPLQKKNEMPMGSLLTNLPTTANPPPESGLFKNSSCNKQIMKVIVTVVIATALIMVLNSYLVIKTPDSV